MRGDQQRESPRVWKGMRFAVPVWATKGTFCFGFYAGEHFANT
jgi:hypothetical protein